MAKRIVVDGVEYEKATEHGDDRLVIAIVDNRGLTAAAGPMNETVLGASRDVYVDDIVALYECDEGTWQC
jgi:hypothetical protein